MSDLIKRQDAITAFCEHECGKGMTREKCGAVDCGTIFDDISSAQQWIPCSERLPEEEGQYLVTLDFAWDKEIEMGDWFIFEDGHGEWVNSNSHVTVAWMPLPEPYKGVEE